jgi:transposase
MSKGNFTEEFKRDAVRQITERGYPVAVVSRQRPTTRERNTLAPHLPWVAVYPSCYCGVNLLEAGDVSVSYNRSAD